MVVILVVVVVVTVVAICSGRVKVCVTSAARAVVWLALYVCIGSMPLALALVRRHGRDRAVESRARDAQ